MASGGGGDGREVSLVGARLELGGLLVQRLHRVGGIFERVGIESSLDGQRERRRRHGGVGAAGAADEHELDVVRVGVGPRGVAGPRHVLLGDGADLGPDRGVGVMLPFGGRPGPRPDGDAQPTNSSEARMVPKVGPGSSITPASHGPRPASAKSPSALATRVFRSRRAKTSTASCARPSGSSRSIAGRCMTQAIQAMIETDASAPSSFADATQWLWAAR